MRVMTTWELQARTVQYRNKTHNGRSDSVIGDIYGNDEHENVQRAAAASRNLNFATSFSVWPNQPYSHVRTLNSLDLNQTCLACVCQNV
jgi:hypothetical protein